MGKKINVSSLLNAAMNDDMSPAETVKNLKAQRNEGTSPDINPGSSRSNSNFDEISNASISTHRNITATKEHPKIIGLEHLLAEENFSDRKEQFIFRLSQQCFDDYEELTRTVNYKLHKKLSRNDIMRKVLEHYHTNELEDLLRLLHNI
ncbi:hypothetical protein [Sediminicola luteus]|uniref:Uncharacterized protein n=1 Tax=Sediminicola luteus TaxID=319238 RepID=A0A2A4GAG3_9FLAO|nr:hypothetical protein [Sediminicola luteus]PCE64968.1 hypothetical protein B7P33_07360 [Sediminicola luteus]